MDVLWGLSQRSYCLKISKSHIEYRVFETNPKTAYCPVRRIMQIQDTKLTETSQETPVDPFACLSHQIYISGELTLIRTPAGTCGEWLCVDDIWHRRLTACAFVWIRDAVKSAISSGKLSEDFRDAISSLEWIAGIGIQNGFFTPEEIADHVHAPGDWQWGAGIPMWAMDF